MALSGNYYDAVKAGRVFIGSTAAAGVALPVETGTAATLALWNTSTDKVAIPISIHMAYVSGTITVGGFAISNVLNAGYAVAAGGPVTAFTDGVVNTGLKNAYLGSGNASSMRFAPATATVSAGTRCYLLGAAHEIATAGPGVSVIDHEFKGRLAVPPGQLIFPSFSIAQTGVFSITLVWEERLLTA
jgi:hypothetical protein